MSERINKTSICSIVFLDIIEYSKKPVYEQLELKQRFNSLISEAIKNVAQNDRILLDTGDGAAIALMGAPEEALFIALTIRDGILKENQQYPQPLCVRIGINLGPVRVMTDINDHLNIIGDGINDAQRVMSFAEANQILVSRSYYEITSRLSREIAQMFAYSGVKHDKHIREHEVYRIRGEEADVVVPPVAEPVLSTDAPRPMSGKKWKIGAGIVAAVVVTVIGGLVAKSKAPVPQQAVVQPSAPLVQKPQLVETDKSSAKTTAAGSKHAAVAAKPPKKPAAKQKRQQVAEEKKRDAGGSSLDKLVDSVKQGNTEPECSAAARSMNQCR